MRTKIINANLVDVESGKVVPNSSVVINGGIIEEVLTDNISGENFEKTIDFKNDLLMPAFINAHTHSAMTLFRSIADDISLEKWLFDHIFPLEKKLTSEDIYNGTMLAVLEYVRGGIATIGDMYSDEKAVLDAAKLSGINVVCVGGASDISKQAKEQIEIQEDNYLNLNGKLENFSYIIGCHAEYTCSENLIDLLVDLSYKYKTPLYTHASETLKEVGDCAVRHDNLSPILYLSKHGFFDNGAILAHCVHADKDDIKVLQKNDVSVVHNPSSNLKLASGIAPVYTMQKNGINVVLGTDGAASNNSLDMFKEMYLSSVLQKAQMSDACAGKAHDSIKMATLNGARALNLKNRGVIKKGYKADLIRVDINGAHMQPNNNLFNNLVYAAKSSDVLMTMANGKILYENGSYFIGEKPERIVLKAKSSIKRLTEGK
ncbi:MAG: amidohydrolase [Firmicutes bacterium]|nr:amidohydrolase [Bacillota bacterium]